MTKVNIKPAATGRYSHQYNPLFVGSLDFGEIICSRFVEVEKSDDWNFAKVKGTLRLAPQVFPAYGKNTLKTAVFFVPMSQISETYDQFRNNKTVWKGKPVKTPYFDSEQILEMFYDHKITGSGGEYDGLCWDLGDDVSENVITSALMTSGTHWDTVYLASDGNYHALRLSAAGKKFYKVLKMLGYDFPSYGSFTSQQVADAHAAANSRVNAYNLLAYLKCYVDYFLNAQLYNTDPLVSFLQHIHDDENYTNGNWSYQNGKISTACLYECLYHVLVPYESNMYLEAWNSPNSPTGVSPESEMVSINGVGQLSPYLPVTTGDSSGSVIDMQQKVVSDSKSTFLTDDYTLNGSHYNYLQSLSKLGQNVLDSIYKFVRRNNLFGSKPIQQILARFGIKDSDWNTHFVHKLYEGASKIDYSAVVSQTDNYDSVNDTGKTLGAYSGFGVSGLDFKFKYKAQDHGFLFVLHWVQITPIITRGFDPSVLRLYPQDWYTPEFDGKTLRAIPFMEIGLDKWGRANAGYVDRSIYGFTDLYEEYRHMRDSVIGDFVTDENGVNQFFFGRDFSYWRYMNSAQFKPQNNLVQYMNRWGLNPDMTDPFQMSNKEGDRYYLFIKFDIKANRHITSKSSSLDLNGEGDLEIQLGGTQIS